MYCSRCNTKGKLGDIYCSECGSKLIRKKIDFKISKKLRNLLIIFLATFIVLFSTYKVIEYINSPKFIATNYFKDVINNDSNKLYDYIENHESTFVTSKLLQEKMKLYEEVTSYKIVNVLEEGSKTLVTFEYVINDVTYEAYVLLKEESKYFIFKSYSVMSGNLVKDVSFVIPKNSTITVDGIDISNLKVKSTDEYYDTYKIPYMVNGTYTVVTTTNGIKTTEETDVSDNMEYYVNEVKLSDELNNTLEKESIDKLNLIYSSIVSKNDFSSIAASFNVDTKELEKTYKVVKRNIISDDYTINSFTITSLDAVAATYIENGKLAVTYDADYLIKYSYLNGTETVSKEIDSHSYITISYDYINQSYTLYNLENYIGLRG